MRGLARLSVAAALAATPVLGSPFGDTAAVSDAELAVMRGGLLLPNGLDVVVGVAIETRVDGQLALRTMLSTEGAVQVFSGGGAAAAKPQSATATSTQPAAPMIRIDRDGAGTVISPIRVAPNVQVGVSRGPAADAGSGGGTQLPLTANGAPVVTPAGAIRLEESARGLAVVLEDPTLEIRHLVGAATGVAVANTADNRVIDTVATVNIDLRNASEFVGGNLLQIDRIATDAASRNPF